MLINRATGEICRLVASDALHGMPYAAEELDGYVHGEIAPQKAPLSVAAITAPQPAHAAPEAPQQPAEPEYTVARDDESDDGLWDHDAVNGSTDWPEPAQPGSGA